ncbi:DUF6083 domain-containing protein [Streptomyces sp. NBC_00457]|uniref:DUF6083 domain-containing protein n=1 Tax=Streptomyces sp. NBC_00457 TaxID=2975748 RepID=UPI002E1DF595
MCPFTRAERLIAPRLGSHPRQRPHVKVVAWREFSPPPARPWSSSPKRQPREHPPRRSLRVDPTGVSRLLRCGQTASCHECGNPVEWYVRSDERQVRLHPHEMPSQ